MLIDFWEAWTTIFDCIELEERYLIARSFENSFEARVQLRKSSLVAYRNLSGCQKLEKWYLNTRSHSEHPKASGNTISQKIFRSLTLSGNVWNRSENILDSHDNILKHPRMF
jgi:hypothetical protein